MNTRRLTIASRLGLLLAGLAVIGAVVVAWALSEVHAMRKETRRLADVLTPQMLRMQEMEKSLIRVSLLGRHAILSRTPAELQATVAEIARYRARLDEVAAEFEANISTEKGRRLFAEVKAKKVLFWQEAGQVLQHVQAGRRDEAFAHLADVLVPARNAWLERMEAQHAWQREIMTNAMDSIYGRYDGTQYALEALLALLCGGGVVCWWLGGRMIRGRAADAAAVADRIAAGDLTAEVIDRRRDELSPLFVSLNNMQRRLVEVVASVQAGAGEVAAASVQIADGNADLRARTESQAASLERTASSMDQFSSTVQTNADTARQATQLASSAAAVAAKGGEVVAKVVSTMEDISGSSRKIADIIGVIDGIAFQTNILALNAAVEAARAGEQGRGFAVVASEVRALASRSAGAAREIKSLIASSVEKVEGGTQLVSEAGATMNDIVAQVRRVADLIDEISSASVEQSQGIGEVTQAVSELDGATQQNAALVGRSAQAASSLREQAERLVGSVGAFRLARA